MRREDSGECVRWSTGFWTSRMGMEAQENSRESDEIVCNKDQGMGERVQGSVSFGEPEAASNCDFTQQPAETGLGIWFRGSLNLGLGVVVPEKQTGNNHSVCDKETEKGKGTFLFGVDIRKMGRDPNDEGCPSVTKRRRYSIEEKGKAKVDDNQLLTGVNDAYATLDHNLHVQIDPIEEEIGSKDAFKLGSSIPGEIIEHNFFDVAFPSINRSRDDAVPSTDHSRESSIELSEHMHVLRRLAYGKELRRLEAVRRHECARDYAESFARFNPAESESTKQEKEKASREIEESEDMQGPFAVAMEIIKKQKLSPFASKKPLVVGLQPAFKWMPSVNRECNLLKNKAPSLLDLSMKVLAKNVEAMVSLQHVPDELRHKLNQLLCVSRKMDAHFVELLAKGSPTEICINDCTRLTEQEFIKIFGSCDTKNLTVLKLDLCGPSISDITLYETLARSSGCLPALITLSVRGAFRLTEAGLTALCVSAPALQSINVSQCSLLTSAAISALTTNFAHTLRELYIDDCQHIDAMQILPALEKLKCLAVLSMAGIETVCDDFVSAVVKACGANMKELVFANCLALTDRSLKTVGKHCPLLHGLDLTNLCQLTDVAIQHLANGCRTIRKLKLRNNNFSDEAVAAFLEVSGCSLRELSLNKISRVGYKTAYSLAKCSRNLFSLDLSWCRNLTDEAVKLIVDNCSSLKMLKLFGCTQITDVFLKGHSNSLVQIVGLKATPIGKHFDIYEAPEAPLCYSSH